jgi:hypothetical protein
MTENKIAELVAHEGLQLNDSKSERTPFDLLVVHKDSATERPRGR